jgi:hypothetical protein
MAVGAALGSGTGTGVGTDVGVAVGVYEGTGAGTAPSPELGAAVGAENGNSVGTGAGKALGLYEGIGVGAGLGAGLGTAVGTDAGRRNGGPVGGRVGEPAGAGLGCVDGLAARSSVSLRRGAPLLRVCDRSTSDAPRTLVVHLVPASSGTHTSPARATASRIVGTPLSPSSECDCGPRVSALLSTRLNQRHAARVSSRPDLKLVPDDWRRRRPSITSRFRCIIIA